MFFLFSQPKKKNKTPNHPRTHTCAYTYVSWALCRQYVTSGQNKTVFVGIIFHFFFFGCQTFYDNLFDYFLVKVQTLSYSWCSQLFLFLFSLFCAIFSVGLVKVYAWCMKNRRRKRKCCTTYAPVRSFLSHIYIRIYICVGIWIDILVFAQVWANKFYCIFFGATWRGSKRTGKCYLCGVLCHSDFKINSFFLCIPVVGVFCGFSCPRHSISQQMKWKLEPKFFSLTYFFLFFFLARLLFALWQSSQKFCLASAISWRQLCVSPLTFAFVWIFRLFLPFSCIGERRKTAIKESLSMHFPSRSALN